MAGIEMLLVRLTCPATDLTIMSLHEEG